MDRHAGKIPAAGAGGAAMARGSIFSAVGIAAALSACVAAPDAPPPAIGVVFAPGTAESGQNAGARVGFVVAGFPGEAGGIREGDIITRFNGQPTRSGADVSEAEKGIDTGTSIPVVLLRSGERITVSVKPVVRPANYAAADGPIERAYGAAIQKEQRAAAEAEKTGDDRRAFDHYVRALHVLYLQHHLDAATDETWTADVAHLEALLPKLQDMPRVPSEAARHNQLAVAAVRNASSEADLDNAAAEFAAAIYEAPWVTDLYANHGLTAAEAGDTEAAISSLNRYLLLAPTASDAEIVKTTLADLAPLAPERKPWLQFQTVYSLEGGGKARISLRGRKLTLNVVTPAPGTREKPGDPLCWGAVDSRRFEGRCNLWFTDADAIACFGPRRDYGAYGRLAEDNRFVIDGIVDIHFDRASCTIESKQPGQVFSILVHRP